MFVCLLGLMVVRGDKLENFDLIFFPTPKSWKGLLTTNQNTNLRKHIFGTPLYRGSKTFAWLHRDL